MLPLSLLIKSGSDTHNFPVHFQFCLQSGWQIAQHIAPKSISQLLNNYALSIDFFQNADIKPPFRSGNVLLETMEISFSGKHLMDERSLLNAARKFDSGALGAIFDAHATDLYNYALRLCQDPIEADGIVGDVFAHLLEGFAKGKGPKNNVRTYLFQIAYHMIVDRDHDKKHSISFEVAQAFGNNEQSVTTQFEDKAMMETLMKAINSSLTMDQRHVLTLRFIEGFSLNETATILGKSINNIKVIENRGIKKLRQTLGDSIEDDK